MSQATTPTGDEESRAEAMQALVDEYPEGHDIHEMAARYLESFEEGDAA